MSVRIHLLDVKKYKIDFLHKRFHIWSPDAAICVDAYVDALLVKCIHEATQFFRLGCGFTSGECYSSFLAEECFLVYGNLDNLSDEEKFVTQKLNQTDIGPLGFGGNTTVLGTFIKIGNQRASGVRIVSVRPSCFVEPRKATLRL